MESRLCDAEKAGSVSKIARRILIDSLDKAEMRWG
jgi:hypothetical protein